MQITLWLFGAEVFSLKIGPGDDSKDDGPGDCTTTPVGFTARFDRPPEFEVPNRDY